MEHTTDHINQNIVMIHNKEAEHQFNQTKMRQKRNLWQQRKSEIDDSERI